MDSGVTLTVTCTVEMSPGTRLIVRPGGKLVIDGGTLTSACDDVMWQGIEVVGDRTKRQIAQYQGTVELKNGAVIENARCGIRTGFGDDNWHTTGGIIKADSAFFVNNRKAVAFLSYTNHNAGGGVIDNQSYFHRCTFSVDNGNLFAQNNTAFLDHVSLWEVRGVKFKGCTFNNMTNNALALRRHAIYAEDAGFTLETYCRSDQSIPQGCECPENTSRYNMFTGFNTAVEANTAVSQYAVNINHALFDSNYTAIKINGNPFVTVTRCEVNLQQVPGQSLSNKGLVLSTCTGYKVEENTFSRNTYSDPSLFSSRGIEVDSSGAVANSIRLNTFTNLGYGIYVRRNNGNHLAGLQATCNGFIHNKYDIYMAANATMKSMQGWSDSGADNTFSSTQTSSFRNSGPQQIEYFYSIGGNHAPHNVNTSYVSVNSNADPGFCSSTLCNNSWQPMLSGFTSQMETYAAAANIANADGTDGGTSETQKFVSLHIRQSLSDTYYSAVRTLMSDTVLNLNELELWHTAAQPIADPYSLTETRFMEGYAEPFIADADDAEMANYAEFHALKLALASDNDNQDNLDNLDNLNSQNSSNSPTTNWYSLTPAQIAQLQTIAERNTGRASVMAKGVLCFFFGICYEDESPLPELRSDKGNTKSGQPQWTYWIIDPMAPVYVPVTYSLLGDTVVDGFSYRISNFHVPSSDRAERPLLVQEDSSGMYYYDHVFHERKLLYPYLAEPGFQYTIYPIFGDTNHLMIVHVDSVAYEDIDNQNVKVLYVSTHDTNYQEPYLHWSFDMSGGMNHAKIIEHIGSTGYFLPVETAYNGFFLVKSLCSYESEDLNYQLVDSVNCNEPYHYSVPQHSASEIRVYPNPAGDLLHIELSCGGGIASVALYDLQGRVVETRHGTSLQGGTATVNLRSVPAGVYLLRVMDAEGKEYMRKIVKK